MPRQARASQFAPFDALKDLRNALKMKEYEVERIAKGDLDDEKIENLTKTLLSLKKNDLVEVTYFSDGHYKTILGKVSIMFEKREMKVGSISIGLDDLFNVKQVES